MAIRCESCPDCAGTGEINQELLDALEEFVNLYDYDVIDATPNGNTHGGYDEGLVRGREVLQEAIEQARAAIAKAKGEANDTQAE